MKKYILGGGITGLAAGMGNKLSIYERSDIPGGICASYYIGLDGKKTFYRIDEETYRFEIGGGHWIFGADNEILKFIDSLSIVKKFERNSAVYFSDIDLYIPYPLQNHLSFLPKEYIDKTIKEIKNMEVKNVRTMADWLLASFGQTLCELFFFPFHRLYTAGLYTKIAPQDQFKTPVNKELILKGINENLPPIGYNATFVYPEKGLDNLILKMADKCEIYFNKKVVRINLTKKEMIFEDGSGIKYEKIISTLPLNKMVEICDLKIDEQPLPYTSVLVLNIGAVKGDKCPHYHWVYVPKNNSGFHRVGFYSNVDSSFLPISSRGNNDRVSIYVEKAYQGGQRLVEKEIKVLSRNIVQELMNWKFIKEAEVVDYTWIEVAYTWEYPDSTAKQEVLEVLRKHNIFQTGRYGKWKFQGIAESIKDGLIWNKE